MAQSLDEQISTIERALGESMIEHALVVVRTWLNELGENNPFEEAFRTIQTQYNELFTRWLNIDEPHAAEELNVLTGDTYQLVDAVYAELRLKRGLSPDMRSFNADSPQSVMNYFANNIRLRPEDFEWLHEVTEDESQVSIALMALNALTRNLRECFNTDAFLAVIDGINASNELIRDQSLANAFVLLIHYDIRIDFFPTIQDAFANAIADMNDGGEHAFDVLCAFIRSLPAKDADASSNADEALNQLPELLREMLEKMGMKDEVRSMMAWIPKSEQEYISGLIQLLPQTWLFEVLVAGEPIRENILTKDYLRLGNREFMWSHIAIAEQYFVELLRKGSTKPMDYINYGHCLLLKGDRMMAFENYRQARQLCGNVKDFFNLFRPDRRQLVDCGVPVEFIYLIEDQLLKGNS